GREAAVRLPVDRDHRVLELVRLEDLDVPAEQLGVELLSPLGIGRHVLVPHERADPALDLSAHSRLLSRFDLADSIITMLFQSNWKLVFTKWKRSGATDSTAGSPARSISSGNAGRCSSSATSSSGRSASPTCARASRGSRRTCSPSGSSSSNAVESSGAAS